MASSAAFASADQSRSRVLFHPPPLFGGHDDDRCRTMTRFVGRGPCSSCKYCSGHEQRVARLRGGALCSSEDDATLEERGSSVSASQISSSYHLIWSSGVWKKMALTTTSLLTLRLAASSGRVELPRVVQSVLHPAGCHHHSATASAPALVEGLVRLLLLPLLSGACCAVQIAIGALFAGAGCAGFNTYLGPLRPYFLSVMLVSAVSTMHSSWSSLLRNPARAAAVLTTWAVALLPEAVHARNDWLARRWGGSDNNDGVRGGIPMELLAARGATSDAVPARSVTLELIIPTMGCVACVNKIDSSVRGCSPRRGRVVQSSSWITDSPKGGKARVVLAADTSEDMDELVVDVQAV